MHESCIPPISIIIHTSEGHPLVGSPYISFLIIINTIMTNAKSIQSIPKNEEITSGAVENPMTPSIEYINNFQNDHFVSPATLSTFSYSNHLVSNPTQP